MPLWSFGDSLPQVSQKIDQELQNQWTLRRQIQLLNPENDPQTLENIVQYQLENKITGLPLFTEALLMELNPAEDNATLEKDYRWRYAVRFSPSEPMPHALLCRWQSSPNQWNSILSHCFKALSLRWQQPHGKLYLKAVLDHALYITLFMVLGMMVVSFMIKYIPFILQYYSSLVGWLSPLAFGTILSMVMTTAVLTFGWLVGLCIWTLLIWRFIHRLEKYLWVLLEISIIFFPVLFHAPALFIAKTELLPYSHYTSQAWLRAWQDHSPVLYENAFQTLFAQTFHQPTIEYVQIIVLVTVVLQFILASTTKISDYYFVYEKKERFTKKTVIKELRPYQKLYFKYLHALRRRERSIRTLYNVLPHHFWLDQNKPLVSLVVLTGWAFCLSSLWIWFTYMGPDAFPWGVIFFIGLLGIYISTWRMPKPVKDQDLYEKK